jgi:hypothetical protein
MGPQTGGPGDNREPHEPAPFSNETWHTLAASAPYSDVEPGWKAMRSLLRIHNDVLLSVMLRPSFRPVRDLDLVRVAPCPYCHDGGLRTAGSVRVRKGRVAVRACDTCAIVDIGDQPLLRPATKS